jgi:hypothetical protein
MTARLSAEAARRLNTWIVQVTEAFLRQPAYEDHGAERRYSDTGLGLQINRVSGAWFSFASGRGGWSAVELLVHLHHGDTEAAVEYGLAWLAGHAGEGEQRGADDEADEHHETRRLVHRARATELLAEMTPLADTQAEAYLTTRKLPPPYPEGVTGFIHQARPGDDALVLRLVDHGRTTGVMLTFIDALAAKSLGEPTRQRFDCEAAPGAYFPIKPPGQGRDGLADIVFCEGYEDGESVRRLGNRPWEIRGLPGIVALAHQDVARGTRVLIVADGDPEGSPAAKALAAGIDHLIDCGAEVKLAQAAAGKDANDYLVEHTSTAPLLTLLTSATKAKLSAAGEAARLSRLDALEAAGEVSDVAQRLGIPVADLRREIARRRRRREKAEGAADKIEAEVAAAAAVLPKDAAWTDPLPSLGELLDDCLKEIKRFLWLPVEAWYYVVVTWCLHTHFVHHAKIKLSISPRLGLRSETENSGKTTALDVAESLSATATSATSITSSVIFRLVDRYQVSLFIDEAEHQGIRNPHSDTHAILNAGHRRSKAKVWRSVPPSDGKGDWVPTPFNVWGAMAFAYIGELPRTLRSRCITLPMHPAPAAARLTRWEDGDPARWASLRRQLAAYAASCDSLPRVELPETMVNRLGDNWDVLFRLASKAGTTWLDRIQEAAGLIVGIPEDPPFFIRLLLDIRDAFAELPMPKDGSKWISTRDLLDNHLLADAEAGWDEANSGRPINETWLSRKLRKHLKPPRSLMRDQKDREEVSKPSDKPLEINRNKARGYAEIQFAGVNAAYLAAYPSPIQHTSISHPLHVAPVASGLGPEPSATGATGDGYDLEGDRERGVSEGLRAGVVSDPALEEDDLADLDPAVVDVIRLCRLEHPSWSVERVRNKLHIKRSVVERCWRATTPAATATAAKPEASSAAEGEERR